jgi:tight adherence protein C
MVLYLVPPLTALTLIAASLAVYQLQARRRHASNRLKQVIAGAEAPAPIVELTSTTLPVWLRFIGFFAWLMPGQIYSEALQVELAQAGYRHTDARKVFVGARVLCTVLLGLAAVMTTWTLRMLPQEVAVISLAAAAFGFYLPVAALRFRQNRRAEEISLSLPDALDLLVICVEAGHGLNAALLKVGKECADHARAISDELAMVNNEMRAGVPRTQALRNLAMRCGSDDVRALVGVMIQSDKFGTGIAHALRTHAASLRTLRRQRAEEAARKTPVKLVFPLVFCIFPELMVVILAPGMLELYRALSKMSR